MAEGEISMESFMSDAFLCVNVAMQCFKFKDEAFDVPSMPFEMRDVSSMPFRSRRVEPQTWAPQFFLVSRHIGSIGANAGVTDKRR